MNVNGIRENNDVPLRQKVVNMENVSKDYVDGLAHTLDTKINSVDGKMRVIDFDATATDIGEFLGKLLDYVYSLHTSSQITMLRGVWSGYYYYDSIFLSFSDTLYGLVFMHDRFYYVKRHGVDEDEFKKLVTTTDV